MKSNIQSSKTKQKRLTKLKNICTLSLLAGSMISLMPATALGNNKSHLHLIYSMILVFSKQLTKYYLQRPSRVKTAPLMFTLICSGPMP